MKRNILFILIAALLLAPWPVVYAYEGVSADTEASFIQPAEQASAPQIQAYGSAIGHVSGGDLFYVDMTGTQGDASCQLIIANADELVRDYRFMNMKVGIFVQGEDENHWSRLTASNGDTLPDIYITMHSGMADFMLPGGARYKITIDTGCYYCYGRTDGNKAKVPLFNLSMG
jgi:hypothetical protein